MNESYPTSTVDYDCAFLSPVLRSIFKRNELKQCGETGLIKHLNREKLKFAKGKCRFTKEKLQNIHSLFIFKFV